MLFRYYLPLQKGGVLHLNNNRILLLKNALCQIWLILAQWFWKKRFFFDTVFSLFRYYIILEQGGALHLNSIVLIEIDPGVLDKKIFKFCQSFVIIFPWEKGGALNLNKLESPFTLVCLNQVWLKSGLWFWRRKKCEKLTTTMKTTTKENNRL